MRNEGANSKAVRLSRAVAEQRKWKQRNERTAIDSITDFVMAVLRPVVKAAVTAVFKAVTGWFRGLFG